MEDKYKKLLGFINSIEPPKGLETRVMARISGEEKRLARIKIWAFGGSSIASFGLLLWAVIYLVKSVRESGFWQYFSLVFSENGAIFAYWRELSLSLAESLPIASFIIFFAAIGFFVWSFANAVKKDTGKFIMSFN